MTKEFRNINEIKSYYNGDTNTYIFKDGNKYIKEVVFHFDLDVNANIEAHNLIILGNNIKALNIKVQNIYADNISALNIMAKKIVAEDINAKNINTNDIVAFNIVSNDVIAHNICANDVIANNVYANEIDVQNIEAMSISYHTICRSHHSIKCNKIKGETKYSVHFVIDEIKKH